MDTSAELRPRYQNASGWRGWTWRGDGVKSRACRAGEARRLLQELLRKSMETNDWRERLGLFLKGFGMGGVPEVEKR